MTYTPPIRDLTFALIDVAGAGALRASFAQFDADTISAVLETAGSLAADENLIDLDDASESATSGPYHGSPKLVQPIPGCVIATQAKHSL